MTTTTAPHIPPTLVSAARALRRGELTSRQLVSHAIASRRDELGAYRSVDDEHALAQAAAADAALAAGFDLGPLMGLPISVKDLFGVPGFRTYGGTPRALAASWEQAGPVVQALRSQLGVVVGKTHTVELAFGGIGTNPHYPTPKNPWDADAARVPGGSSAGAGVSLVEGSALLALGTDTAGSVRIPASFCGVVGLKTTVGRWSTRGIVPLSASLDTAGILARDVADVALAFEAIDGRVRAGDASCGARRGAIDLSRLPLSRLRLARCDQLFWSDCSPGVVETVDAALGVLVQHGADVARVELPEVEAAYQVFLAGGPVAIELERFLQSELPEALDTLDPNVRARLQGATTVPASEYLQRLERLAQLGASAAETIGPFDALVAPTVALTPPTFEEVADGEGYRRNNLLALRNTSSANYLGWCAITLPVGCDAAGMPVGLMLMGRGGTDAHLIEVARAVQAELGDAETLLGVAPRL
ncbi:MAG: amidase [Myxococcales bacterium]|nr:amidase [Myxococcales bacterium]